MAEIKSPINRYCDLKNEVELLAKKYNRNLQEIKILVVTKGKPVSCFNEFIEAGIQEFAESRIQEVLEKKMQLPDCTFHLIGTLQTKKVPKVIGLFKLIHSVDSLELARKISDSSVKQGIVQDVLLQVNTSNEEAKHGFTKEQLLIDFEQIADLPGISLRGLMTMAAHMKVNSEEERELTRKSFSLLSDLKKSLNEQYKQKLNNFTELSMGMSQDYEIAIEQGATILRIGSHIFSKM